MSGGDTEDDEQFWEEHKDHIYKIMVVGPSYVGKTQLVQCYVNRKRTLDPDYIPTKVLGFESDETSIDCVMKYIHVYDASGNRDDLIMVESYFSAMNAFVFVFDLSNEQSFQELKDFWVKKVQAKANVHTKYVLVGNKVDKKNARVEFEPAKEFAKVCNINKLIRGKGEMS